MSNDLTGFRLLTCESETGKRTELNVPFRCVCPDANHMITRCFETGLRKMAQKITDIVQPHKKFVIQRFDKKLTRRGPKSHFFISPHVYTGGTNKAGKVGAVSFSGICALTVIADKEEMMKASTEMEDFFEGAWKKKLFAPKKNTDTYVKSVKNLQAIYLSLVSKVPGKTVGASPPKMPMNS